MADEEKDVPEAHGKLKPELARLHVASVKLQQWVVRNGRSAAIIRSPTTPSGSFPKSSELLRRCETWQSRRGERHE